MLAWHFIQDDGRIRCNIDRAGRRQEHGGVLVQPGQTLRLCEPLVVRGSRLNDPSFAQGLFGSFFPAEALFHAPGLMACRVKLGGEILQHEHYAQASERTCLWMVDATKVVWKWACLCGADYVQEARKSQACVEPVVTAAINMRWAWLNGRAREDDLAALVGPTRQAMRRACGLDSRGKRSDRPCAIPDVQFASRLAHALTVSRWYASSGVAARRPGWYDTARGKLENNRLEQLLIQLAAAQCGLMK